MEIFFENLVKITPILLIVIGLLIYENDLLKKDEK